MCNKCIRDCSFSVVCDCSLAYIHSQMNLHMCAKFGINRYSRLIAFPEFVLR